MLYVSFLMKPNQFPRRLHWHAQMSHHIYNGHQLRFGKESVEFVKWESSPQKPAIF